MRNNVTWTLAFRFEVFRLVYHRLRFYVRGLLEIRIEIHIRLKELFGLQVWTWTFDFELLTLTFAFRFEVFRLVNFQLRLYVRDLSEFVFYTSIQIKRKGTFRS